jgi:Iap family predicted aminopeptidase
MGDVGPASPTTGAISAAAQLAILAYDQQRQIGASEHKYVIVGAGADTYVIADTDNVLGYDQVVLLKNVVSSLVTADMFMAA